MVADIAFSREDNIILTDRENCDVLDAGIAIALKLQELYPAEFKLERYNRLLIHGPTLEAIREQKPLEEIKKLWAVGLKEFRARREKYLLYK